MSKYTESELNIVHTTAMKFSILSLHGIYNIDVLLIMFSQYSVEVERTLKFFTQLQVLFNYWIITKLQVKVLSKSANYCFKNDSQY